MTPDEAICQFVEYLEVEKDFSPLTVKAYQRYLTRFSMWVADGSRCESVENIDLELIRRFRLHLARIVTPTGDRLKKVTQTYHLIALRALMRYLSVQRGMAVLSPDRIELPKAAARTVTFLGPDDLESLLSAPDTTELPGIRDRAILETLFSTGLRVSELARLNRGDIDIEGRELGVIGKGRKPRVVFLSDSAVEWIARYLESREEYFKPLFIRHTGTVDPAKGGERMRLTPRSIQRIVQKYARIAYVPVKTSPHTLRHTFATDLLIAGADIRSVQEMLGHQSITTTQVYTHVTDRHLKEVHRSFHGKRKKPEEE